jgi:hypothetical protein
VAHAELESALPSGPVEHAIVVRQQAWFRPCLDVEALAPFPVEQIHVVSVQPTNIFRARTLIGRGPIDHELPKEFLLWFENGEENYPVFQVPSIGPRGAALKVSAKSRRLALAADEALGLVEISLVRPVPRSFREKYEQDVQAHTPDAPPPAVDRWLAEAKAWLERAIGCYALYQYPIVWEPLGVHALIGFVDLATRSLQMAMPLEADNFIPFRLNVGSRVADGRLVDDGLVDLARLDGSDLHLPLVMLQRALWQRNVELRFLDAFLLLDYLAGRVPLVDPSRPQRERLYQVIENFISTNHPEHQARVRALKHIIVQSSLHDRLTSYFDQHGIAIDAPALRAMLRVRNELVHARRVDESTLGQVELQVREWAREAMRRELELQGVTFGNAT